MTTIQRTDVNISIPTNINHNSLYHGQKMAAKVVDTNWFPCYSTEYIQSQGRWKGTFLQTYSKVYDGVSILKSGSDLIGSVLGAVASKVASVFYMTTVTNEIYPVNLINNKRHFTLIPRSVEKVIGDYLIYPLATYQMHETYELMSGETTLIAEKVTTVLTRLVEKNHSLLNPTHEKTQFEYRAKTVASSQINAFACPGGGMVVFSQIVKEVEGAIKSGSIKESTVHFADGSTAVVNLASIELNDVLAALLGHEMTHIASRHGIVALLGSFFRSILLMIGRIILIAYLKSADQEYQNLIKKLENTRTEDDKNTIARKEKQYTILNDCFCQIGEWIKKFNLSFYSQKNEYEADVTGAYFAHKAGYNPLGAIYLQEMLHKDKGVFNFFHKNLELFFTHPYGENRKRALFAAIREIAPEKIRDNVTQITKADKIPYDVKRSSAAIQYGQSLSEGEGEGERVNA